MPRYTESTPPAWAQALVDKHKPGLWLRWYPVSRIDSSGKCISPREIRVYAGWDRTDARFTVLHEIAHALVPWREGHSYVYYQKAFDLYKQHRLAQYAMHRESRYKKVSTIAARDAGVKGSAKFLKWSKTIRRAEKLGLTLEDLAGIVASVNQTQQEGMNESKLPVRGHRRGR